ncbi:unnamed protein product [Albugo candida]|uniref:Uncharacterized protein n=1 Tax=Albugo candida TaxID=65357 RepID=A0A024GM27_9STRA|nr:unnamed protein product [Albugo candida]|eukprot:CCI47387.1 unnamed protein product [Albugo candida]
MGTTVAMAPSTIKCSFNSMHTTLTGGYTSEKEVRLQLRPLSIHKCVSEEFATFDNQNEVLPYEATHHKGTDRIHPLPWFRSPMPIGPSRRCNSDGNLQHYNLSHKRRGTHTSLLSSATRSRVPSTKWLAWEDSVWSTLWYTFRHSCAMCWSSTMKEECMLQRDHAASWA